MQIDSLGDLPKSIANGLPIHRPAQRFEDLSTSSEVLFTIIKSNRPYWALCKRR